MTEFKRILCAVDFSEYSRRALDHALAVARGYGGVVTALHVADPAPATAPAAYFATGGSASQTLTRHDRASLAAQLLRLARAVQVPDVSVETMVTEAPAVHREILVQAERLDADLVVLGTHGRSGFERLFLGSTTEKVLRQATCPVLTVPPAAPDAMPRGAGPFERILCAVDFSDASAAALEDASSLAVRSHAALTVAHVIETRPLYYDFCPAALVDLGAWTNTARRRLEELIPTSLRSACTVTAVAREGVAYREIVQLAAEWRADLIVLGVRGRGAVDLLVLGSTTHHVIREAGCAVLTVRR